MWRISRGAVLAVGALIVVTTVVAAAPTPSARAQGSAPVAYPRSFADVAEAVSWGRVDSRIPGDLARDGHIEVIVVGAGDATVARSLGAGQLETAQSLTAEFAGRKSLLAALPGIEIVDPLPVLNATLVRVESASALVGLANSPAVSSVAFNESFERQTAESSLVVRAPQATARGYGGAGTYVGVVDSGADYTTVDLGSCTAPGVPAATCRVAVLTPDFSTVGGDGVTPYDDGVLDDSVRHGTNVASIVAKIAPLTKLIVADVFGPDEAFKADILRANQYFINLKSSGVPIRAVNFSLGSKSFYSDSSNPACDGSAFGMAQLLSAGILPVVASGNAANNGSSIFAGIGSPACVSGVVSVGATYDANVGGLRWGSSPGCVDSPTFVDKIACFSQFGPNLTMLAPGALITAGGVTLGGTSQATPHVAAAIAVLASAVPSATVSQLRMAVATSSINIFDSRAGRSFPRLDIPSSIDAMQVVTPNALTADSFDHPMVLAGASGSVSGIPSGLTFQGGEFAHGLRNGGRTTWFRWTAPSNGQVTFSTVGSAFDTAMSMYTGATLGALREVAADDDSASTGIAAMVGPVQVVGGTTYQIGVNCGDDLGALACGNITMSWSFSSSTTPPNNDAIAAAIVLSGPTGSTFGSNAFASKQSTEPDTVVGAPASRSIWFRIPARSRQSLTLSTAGSNFDSVLAVYGGADPSSLVLLGSHDDVGPTTNGFDVTSRLAVSSLSEGQSYWIAVDSQFDETGTAVLAWEFQSGAAPQAPGAAPGTRSGAAQATSSGVPGPRLPAPGRPIVSIS